MPTSQNTFNTKLSETASKTYTATKTGNDHGSITFGYIHKQGETIADVKIQASDARHSIVLDKDGPRKGCTQVTAPGRITIDAAIDRTEAEETLVIHAHNGNIAIVASNGKLRLQGTDIELMAVGEGGSKGNIRIHASEHVELSGQKITMESTTSTRIVSSGILEIAASGAMSLYSSVIRGVSAAVATKDSKVGGQSIYNKFNNL